MDGRIERVAYTVDTDPVSALWLIGHLLGAGSERWEGSLSYHGHHVGAAGWAARARALARPRELRRRWAAARRREWLSARAEGWAERTRLELEFDLGPRSRRRLVRALERLGALAGTAAGTGSPAR